MIVKLRQLIVCSTAKHQRIHVKAHFDYVEHPLVLQNVVGELGALRHVEKVLLEDILHHLLSVRDDDSDEEVDHGDGHGQDHEDQDDQSKGAADFIFPEVFIEFVKLHPP